MNEIYLDYNATTPIDKVVADFMKDYLYDHFGNPSSNHSFGVRARMAVEEARKSVATLLECMPDEIIFTGGGTESNNLAIKGYALANRTHGNHIITSSIEHPAVLEVCRYLETLDFRVSYLPVDSKGMIDPDELERSIQPDTILVSIMHANNEIGTIQPIRKISKITAKHHIALHTDAAQSIGKIPVSIRELNVDMLSVAGHKFYGPKGIGALYVGHGVRIQKLIHGAGHESGQRAGTENVLEIAGMGKACELVRKRLDRDAIHMKNMRDLLKNGLKKSLENLHQNGDPEHMLPNTLSLSFPGTDSNLLLQSFNGIAASSGAACHADHQEASRVLQAIGLDPAYARGTVRFSTGRTTTEKEIMDAIDIVSEKVRSLSSSCVPEKSGNDSEEIRLTQFTHGMGCACKMDSGILRKILARFPAIHDPDVLVDSSNADDAAVYKINRDTAIVVSLDFFTPIADDPVSFGSIAAANALSDIYAMGARPLFALNILGFPVHRLPLEVLHSILKGARTKCAEAGIPILGGHSIEDTEPKYGLVVCGIIHPERIVKNNQAEKGDLLILTKPLGTGIITTAMKKEMATDEVIREAVRSMEKLNDHESEAMKKLNIRACTDVTGFGLLGHLHEMCAASRVNAEISYRKIPLLNGAYRLCSSGAVPGGTKRNLKNTEGKIKWDRSVSPAGKLVLCDAQTSGGLLFAVGKNREAELMQLQKSINTLHIIGRITGKGPGKITVLP